MITSTGYIVFNNYCATTQTFHSRRDKLHM